MPFPFLPDLASSDYTLSVSIHWTVPSRFRRVKGARVIEKINKQQLGIMTIPDNLGWAG